MRRAARAFLLACVTALALGPHPARAAEGDPIVLLFLVPGLSYDEALSQPTIRALAGPGGIALMATPSRNPMDNSGYLSLGAGALIEASNEPVYGTLGDDSAEVEVGRHVVDDHGGEPGALAEALARSGHLLVYVSEVVEPEIDLPGLLTAADRRGRVLSPLHLDPESSEEADVVMFDPGRGPVDLSEFDRFLRELLASANLGEPDRLLVVLASPAVSAPMVARGDITPALVVSELTTQDFQNLSQTEELPGGLTSDSTRRPGVVSVVDVAPTILEFLGVPVPAEMAGSPLRAEGAAPTDLHRRFLEFQAARVPVQAAGLALLVGAMAAGILLLFVPAPSGLRRVVLLAGVAAASLPVALLPVGYLPTFSYGVLLPAAVGSVAAVTAVAWLLGRHPEGPFVVLARLAVVALVLEALLGWGGMTFSFLGGSSLEGGRFFGMTNPYGGVLLAAGVLSATRLPAVWGAALLAACALFAGAPGLGANLGAGITLAAAAGLWLAVRARDRLGVPELAAGAAAAVAGLALLLAWHGAAPEPTHVTRVVDEAGRSGPGALAAAALHRLGILLGNTSRQPGAWVALAGLPVGLAIAWKEAGPFGPLLRRSPSWRSGVTVLALAGIVGFVANDTTSTAAVAAAYVWIALVFPSLEDRWTTAS